jgi:hypothetical protein
MHSLTSTVASVLPRRVVTRTRPPLATPQAFRVGGAHPERAVGVLLAPGGVAEDRVRGRRAALPGGENERELGVSDRPLVAQPRELVEELGDAEVDLTDHGRLPRMTSRTQVRPLIACDHPIAVMASSAT